MQKVIWEIADILEKELHIQKELLGLSKELTDVIINGEIKELDNILKVQQTMIMTLGKLEEERMEISSRLGDEDITMTDLIARAEGKLAVRLQELFDDFSYVIDEQKTINNINKKLLKTNLEYIEFTLSNLTGNKTINLFDEKA